jgi:hypothetical protein
MTRIAWVWLAAALALAGCEAGGEGNALGICSTVCRCLTGLPGEQEMCVDECVAEEVVADVTSACERCVFQNAGVCTNLFVACFNGGPCDPGPQPDPDPVPPMMVSGAEGLQEEERR